MWRQYRYLRERIEDQLILEKANSTEGLSYSDLESRIVIPRHAILLQIFPLYILPVVVIIAGYLILRLTGLIS